MSTDCEADAPITTPSRRFVKLFLDSREIKRGCKKINQTILIVPFLASHENEQNDCTVKNNKILLNKYVLDSLVSPPLLFSKNLG